MKKYVRCRYCDSAFNVEDIEDRVIWMGNRQDIKHRRVELNCPACGWVNEECFVFTPDD